jgi:hypothetical protein
LVGGCLALKGTAGEQKGDAACYIESKQFKNRLPNSDGAVKRPPRIDKASSDDDVAKIANTLSSDFTAWHRLAATPNGKRAHRF